ncbi:hypothetical protein Tco_1447330 [Tanacetum coccineum]
MRPSEIHKFCDATLRRTLEGLKSYYNDVKYGYVQKELTNDELEFLKLFEEEIEVRLKYRDQMRRWEINTTDPSVTVTDSSTTDYDSLDESSVCSTPLPPLKKLDGAELISGPKTIKSILRSKSTFKVETLKGVKINEPSSAPAKGNKSSPASKVNSAPAGKLKSVKIKDDPPFAIVIKELNDLKLQISQNQSSYSRNNQQVPQNALQNKYKIQLKKNYDLCGLNNHLLENYYKVMFCKKFERTDHRTCDHAEYISTMNMSQHLKSLGRSSSRS